MRVLFVSGELIAGDLAYRLVLEGCDVKLYIKDKSRKDCFDGMVKKTNDWKKELKWVGKNGLIIFDDIGYGKIQDELRSKGYLVVGGSAGGDRLEKERNYCQKIFSFCGIDPIETHDFDNTDSAINFLNKKKNKKAWVLKQNNHNSAISYVGEMLDGADVLNLLHSYKNQFKKKSSFTLQKKVNGIEVAVGCFFNGKDWASQPFINIEHKKLLDGDNGPLTGEMGTIGWYATKKNKLFRKTLSKLKPYLVKNKFKGYIDINCIVNKNKIFPLEITARFGCPTNQLQSELHFSSWNNFLYSIAKEKPFDLITKKKYGIVVSLAIPPFPLSNCRFPHYTKDVKIMFKEGVSERTIQNKIHFEEVKCKKTQKSKKEYFISGRNGYILYATESCKDILAGRKKIYSLINKIVIPKKIYRSDIGLTFYKKNMKILKKLRWI